MLEPTTSPSILSSYHRMDNVLYEIMDCKGILKDTYYDPWKINLLVDLNNSGYIEQKDTLYVLTERGREVIKHVSFRSYKQRIEPGKGKTDDNNQENKKKGSIKFWFMLLVLVQLSLMLTWTLYKF